MGDSILKSIGRSVAVMALVLVGSVVVARPAGALTAEECAELVAEGEQARADLAQLIEGASQGDPGTTTTTSPETASYVAELLTAAAINEFGFVSADAGAPLEVCVPKGTTKLTVFSDPIVVWEGNATSDAHPVSFRVPAGLECGTHRLQATGVDVDESVEFTVAGACAKVAGVTVDGGGIGLPRTGAEIGTTLAVAVGVITIGVAAIRARRARLAAVGNGA